MESFLHDLSWVPPLRNETLTVIFNGLTFLGYAPFFLAFLPLGYWLWDKAMFTRLAILVGIVGLSNAFLKDLFQDPRPPLEFALDRRVGDSYGLPSGHATVAVAMWLWLAYEIKRAWAWGLAVVIALGVCASRIYLGVHDMEDVLAGALLGLAAIVIYRGLLSDALKPWHDLHPALQVAAVAALVPILYFVWPIEKVPNGMAGLVAFMGLWWLGFVLERELVRYERHPNWLAAGTVSIAGVAVLFWIFGQIGALMKSTGAPEPVAFALQFGFVSLFASLIAPALFRALRLAR